MSRYYCDFCDATHPDHELGTDDVCPDCGAVVSVLDPPIPMDLPEWVTGQPAFTPSYATTDHAERYATDGRYGGYVGVEVVKGSGVYVLRAEEQEEVAT